jgi:ketosteroid isomerase-like protein
MSQENVELVRQIYGHWLRGEMALERMDHGMSMFESTSIPGAYSAIGIEAVRRYIESFARYWEEIRFEPSEYIDAGDRVVVIARLIGRGKGSGVAVQRKWAYVWTLRNGLALRMDGYADRAEALKAVGLEE